MSDQGQTVEKLNLSYYMHKATGEMLFIVSFSAKAVKIYSSSTNHVRQDKKRENIVA